MAKIWYDKDVDLKLIKSKKVAVLGYGSQGHAQAQNLRQSGVKVVVSELPGTDNYKKAVKDGFKPMPAAKAAEWANVIQILLPDEIQAKVYEKDVAPNLTPGKALLFSHGFNIRFKLIKPPKGVDVILIVPKAPGHTVRRLFVDGKGVPMILAVEQNASKKAWELGLSYAKAVGGTRAGVIRTTFTEETETDLFGEQAVLCGGLCALIQAGFETLIKAGYQPEAAYFECCHEIKLITDMINEGGLAWMRYSISDTAEYGDYTRGQKVVGKSSRDAMQKILKDIQSGAFAKEWVAEARSGKKKFLKMRKAEANSRIEKVGANLRKMMSWLKDAKK